MQRFTHLKHVCSCGVIGFLLLWLTGCGALVTPSPSLQATVATGVVKSYPTPGGTQTLYSNALTAPAAGWASGPECAFTGGGLVVRPNNGLAYICLAPTAPLADASVTVTMQQLSGPPTHAFGIVFRHTAPKNYLFFGIDGKGRFTLTAVINDKSHMLIPFIPRPAIHSGAKATNQIQVIARGRVITLLANGSPVGQATLSTSVSGTIGLRGINDGDVVFQHLMITRV